jgi:hypothetical protein
MVLVSLFQGCATLKMAKMGSSVALNGPPELEFRYQEIKEITMEGIKVDLIFAAMNRGESALDTFYVDYDFFIKDKKLVEGRAVKINLIPRGLSKLTLPVTVGYAGLFDTAGDLAKMVADGHKQVDTRVNIRIYGEYQTLTWYGKPVSEIYNFEHDLNMAVPLPEITAQKVKNTLKTAFNTFVGLQVFDTGKAGPSVFRSDVERQVVRVKAIKNLPEDDSIYIDLGMQGTY